MATIDKSENYLTWDDTQAVTVSLIRNAGTTAVSVGVALPAQLSRRDTVALAATSDTAEKVWSVPDALLNPASQGRRITRNDTITDAAGVVWRVVSAEQVEDGTCWRCVCAPQR